MTLLLRSQETLNTFSDNDHCFHSIYNFLRTELPFRIPYIIRIKKASSCQRNTRVLQSDGILKEDGSSLRD